MIPFFKGLSYVRAGMFVSCCLIFDIDIIKSSADICNFAIE